mgnify:CR=1 FL=1
MDGLATGTSAIIGLTLAILAYVSGNAVFSDYLNVLFIPDSGELVVFIAAFVGAVASRFRAAGLARAMASAAAFWKSFYTPQPLLGWNGCI